MEIRLTTITSKKEALELAPALDRMLAAGSEAFTTRSRLEGACAAFLEAHFDAPETLLVLAREVEPGALPSGAPIAVALTGPFVDPIFPERHPLLLLLYVEPAQRHRGLASALLADLASALAARGLASLAARAGHNDDALISMGERKGFTRRWELMLRDDLG